MGHYNYLVPVLDMKPIDTDIEWEKVFYRLRSVILVLVTGIKLTATWLSLYESSLLFIRDF